MKNCPGCGAAVSEDAAFCEYCGATVKKRSDSKTGKKTASESAEGTWNVDADGRPRKTPERVQLKKVGAPAMIAFSFLTFLLYPPIWLLLRKNAFASMSDRTRLHPILPVLFLGTGLALAVLFNGDTIFGDRLTPEALDTATSYILMAYMALSVVITFILRRILREYAARMDKSPLAANLVARSEVFAFIFQLLYIQHHINLLIEAGLVEKEN